MASAKQVTTRGLSEIPLIDPCDGKKRNGYLTSGRMDSIAKRGLGASKELAYTVRESLLKPKAIFKGVREDGEQEWLCYCCRPSKAYDFKTGDCVEAWKDEVFLIFVNDEWIVYNWRWEKCCPTNPDLPENHDSRFSKRVL